MKELFSNHGVVTDLQLKFKQNGAFRHFAFVGFKTKDEAKGALAALNNTYFKSSKISLEFCKEVYHGKLENSKDTQTSKKRKKSKENENIKGDNSIKKKMQKTDGENLDGDQDLQNDPEFVEFLNTHRSAKSTKVWENDGIVPLASKKVDSSSNSQKTKSTKKKAPSVKGTYENTIKLKGIPEEKCNRKCIKEFLSPLRPISLRIPRKVKSIAYAAFKTPEEVQQALGKHRNVMWGSLITVLQYTSPGQSETLDKFPHQQQLSKQASEAILTDTGRIFIRNLAYSCTEEDIEELFKPFGPIAETHLPIDKGTKKIKGFGFITFLFPEHALRAFAELDGTIFQGRMLHLIPGQSKPETSIPLDAKSSFKKKRELDQHKNASSGHNWNSLFISLNAISDAISEKYSIKKSELLMENNPSDSVAVRLALAETQLVNEVKEFLTAQGVKLDAFDNEQAVRSKTTIIVKNLPTTTTTDDLQGMFSRYATVSRVILPPMAVTAIIELDNPSEAKRAFKKLSYRDFKGNPLYLEWAPMDVLSGNDLSSPSQENAKMTGENIPKDMITTASDRTLLVKNLNPDTTEEKLRDHFIKCGQILRTYIVRRSNTQGESKSLGYGFIEFQDRKGAEKALKRVQSSQLDDFTLNLKLSTKSKTVTSKNAVKRKTVDDQVQPGTKILIRNIPFEAVEDDIGQLFSTYGQLKSIRLPKKVTGNHRGFGFVDFVSKEDAKKAFESFSLSTHLYGRRLVLEWSKDESGVTQTNPVM